VYIRQAGREVQSIRQKGLSMQAGMKAGTQTGWQAEKSGREREAEQAGKLGISNWKTVRQAISSVQAGRAARSGRRGQAGRYS
jgi:hypothetical protein